jgi:hypothetical protein
LDVEVSLCGAEIQGIDILTISQFSGQSYFRKTSSLIRIAIGRWIEGMCDIKRKKAKAVIFSR